MDRMIALGARDVREQHERPTENLKAGREFALVRRKPERPSRRPGEREADAMVYINGPAYDRFDGRSWHEEAHSEFTCPLELEPGGAWISLERPTRPIFAGTVVHQIKIGTLSSSPLPLPSNVERFRVGSVNRTDFFGWAQEGIVRMVGRTLPAGTVLETEARTVDPRRLAEVGHETGYVPGRYSTFEGGYSIDPRVDGLARLWAAGVPEGWAQVEAIVAALRRHCTHARDETAPADCTEIVAHFLHDTRRGPDYLFATAAVVLLRSRGYPARVVSGLYAAPERYDVRTRQTPVTREDVHFWAEVVIPGGTTVAIEPTPGYRLLGPSKPWSERLAGALLAAWEWGKAHVITLVLALFGMAAGYRFRGEVRDALATLSWRITSGRPLRGCVLTTLRLVERRSGWAGYPRPPGLTLARWYAPIMVTADASAGDLGRLVRVADWILYAAEGNRVRLPWDERDIRILCRRVVRAWTLGRFRAVVRSRTRRGTAPCSLS
jgi:transglutaminase-like putative cysteine protease